MLALTGATGKLGGAVLNAILEHKLIDTKELVVCVCILVFSHFPLSFLLLFEQPNEQDSLLLFICISCPTRIKKTISELIRQPLRRPPATPHLHASLPSATNPSPSATPTSQTRPLSKPHTKDAHVSSSSPRPTLP
jgi:hypothetical protein